MVDYTKLLPEHTEKYVGENDLFLEIYEDMKKSKQDWKRPPLVFLHGAFTGSWMWSRYIPHFTQNGWKCYVMNLRGHYKSRVYDLTRTDFHDYLEDIREIIAECEEAPILIGFSMGGILAQKLAERVNMAGLVLIDSCICKEVQDIVPYIEKPQISNEIIVPAPEREKTSIDETIEDVMFQVKYLSMESAKALSECSFYYGDKGGISVNHSLVKCPCLVIGTANNEEEDRRGKVAAQYLHGEYTGFSATSHTGLLVGQRYMKVVERILKWLTNTKEVRKDDKIKTI